MARSEQQGKPVVRERAAHTEYCRIERDEGRIKYVVNLECRKEVGECLKTM
jgi:hypothetical protein